MTTAFRLFIQRVRLVSWRRNIFPSTSLLNYENNLNDLIITNLKNIYPVFKSYWSNLSTLKQNTNTGKTLGEGKGKTHISTWVHIEDSHWTHDSSTIKIFSGVPCIWSIFLLYWDLKYIKNSHESCIMFVYNFITF